MKPALKPDERELRAWLEAAEALRPTCQNLEMFDARIAEQRARLTDDEGVSNGDG